jgi:hypothetical protein
MNTNVFTKLVAGILKYDHDQTEEEQNIWEALKVQDPIINNIIVTTPDNTQFNLQVKKVSK